MMWDVPLHAVQEQDTWKLCSSNEAQNLSSSLQCTNQDKLFLGCVQHGLCDNACPVKQLD